MTETKFPGNCDPLPSPDSAPIFTAATWKRLAKRYVRMYENAIRRESAYRQEVVRLRGSALPE